MQRALARCAAFHLVAKVIRRRMSVSINFTTGARRIAGRTASDRCALVLVSKVVTSAAHLHQSAHTPAVDACSQIIHAYLSRRSRDYDSTDSNDTRGEVAENLDLKHEPILTVLQRGHHAFTAPK